MKSVNTNFNKVDYKFVIKLMMMMMINGDVDDQLRLDSNRSMKIGSDKSSFKRNVQR